MAKKTNNNNNGKKNYNKNNQNRNDDYSKQKDQSTDASVPTKHNAPGWYNKATALYETVTMVPFNRLAGVPEVNGGLRMGPQYEDLGKANIAPPSCMTIDYVPGIGKATSYVDPVNRAFQSVYSKLAAKTTGAMQFPLGSFALQSLAAASILQNLGVLMRAYAFSRTYSNRNFSYPRVVLRAMGFDSNSLMNNLADVRTAINNLIMDVNSMSIYGNFDIYKRHFFLSNVVAADNDSARAQLYICRPISYLIYSDLGTYNTETEEYDGLATNITVPLPWMADPDAVMNVFDFIKIVREQITALRFSGDYALVMGSLQRTFTDADFINMPFLAEDEAALITRDPHFLYQIHNLTVAGVPSEQEINQPNLPITKCVKEHNMTYEPVSGAVLYVPMLEVPAIGSVSDRNGYILNSFEEKNITDKDWIMEATRLMSSWTPREMGILIPDLLFTEYVARLTMHRVDGYSGGDAEMTTTVITSSVVSREATMIPALVDLHKFHMAPRLAFYKENLVDMIGYFGDLDTWTLVYHDALQGLNTAALLSIFMIQM